MPASVNIQVSANAQGVYDEIVRQARRAEAIVKKIPLRIETKDLQGFKTLTADIDRFDKSVSRMSAVIITFGQAAALIFGVQNAFAALIKTSISVEKKLNDINAIAQGSATSLQKLSDGLFNIAKQTGQSFDVAATAAQEFSKQGLSVSETLKRTRDALTLTRIAGLDAAKATQSLTAIFNTFNKEALDTTKITNTLANVDTKFAVSAADLTQALSRAGASAADAKVPFNELVAAVTSLQQTTARGGNVIGNSLKSIFTRLQRNDTVQALREIGVEVRDTEGNVRPLMTVLTELSKTFYTLGDAQKASIKEQVAGVYQINQLSALLADLSGGYSTYTNALNTANKTQNEAVDRLEILKNTTAGSLNDMMANLTQFAGDFGKVFTKPLVKNPIDILNSVFDFTKGFADSNEVGAKIGKGLIQGLGTFLGSGGTVLLSKSLFSIGRLVVEGVKDQLIAATTLNRTSEKHLQLQEQIKSVLLSQDAVVQSKLSAASSEAERQKIVLSIIEDQTAAMIRFNAIAGKAASNILQTGYKGPVDAVLRRSASGYLPSMMAEKAAVNNGIGGANRGAKPVVIPNFNLGGGKRETIVANSSEYMIPNFAGGDGSAIFNQDMVKKYGLPSGAQKIMAGGHIPNITASKAGSKAYAAFIKKHGGSVENIQSLFSNLFGSGRIPSTRIEDLKENPLFRNIFMGTKAKTFGFYNYDNNSISLNKAQKADMMLKTYSHEMGHAVEDNLSRDQLDKVKKAFNKDVAKRGESVGETFLGGHAKSYPGAEFSESFAESVSKSFLKKRLGGGNALTDDSAGKNSLMYRYIRREISNRMAGGYIPNFAKFGFGKSPADIDRVGLRRISVKDSPSYLDYGLDKEKKSLFIKFIKSNEKGDAFEMFNRLVKIGKKTKVNQIYSYDLVAQGNRTTTSDIVNSNDTASSVFKLFPQLRYRDQKGLKTSGYLLGIDEKGIKFKSLDHLKKIVGSPQNEGPVKYALNNKSLSFFGLKTKIASDGHIPNFNPLLASLKREASSLQSLGYSKDQIFSGLKVQSSPTLKNNSNPTGLGVFNTLQGQNSIGKALSDHRGENLQRAGIPNFATPQQAVNDIFSNLRKIRGSAYESGTNLPLQFGKSGTKQGFIEAETQMSDLAKSTKLLRSVLPKLILSIEKEIKQIDATIATGNLNLETQKRLNSQKDYLKKSLDKGLSLSANDPRLLRNTSIRDSLNSRAFRVQRANEERLAGERATQAKVEEELAKNDRIKSEKSQKRQSGILLASFATPFITETTSNLLGGEKTRGGRIASGIGGPLSAALSLGTFGGPLGIAAGVGVGGFGVAKSVLENRNVEGFSNRFKAKDELQAISDDVNAQQESFSKFQDAFVKFSDAKGADKQTAGQNLSNVINSFSDKGVSSNLNSIAFGGLSTDDKVKKQTEIQQQAELGKQIEFNIKSFKALYDESISTSSLFSQLNDEVDIAPEKISKFSKLLADTVDINKVSGPIDNKFINNLLKQTNTGIDLNTDNIGVQRIKNETRSRLERDLINSKSINSSISSSEKSSLNIGDSKNRLTSIFTQKDFLNKLTLDSFKARSESPLFDKGTKTQLDNKAARLDILAGFSEGFNKLKGDFADKITGDKSSVSFSKQVDLLGNLLDSTQNNDPESVVKAIESANKTFAEFKDQPALKELNSSMRSLVQNAVNQLTYQKKIADIQAKNISETRLLSLFDKLGLKGEENKGRILGETKLNLDTESAKLREVNKLNNTPENRAKKFAQTVRQQQAFITSISEEKGKLGGLPFSDSRKEDLLPSLQNSFTNVAKSGAIQDIKGTFSPLRKKFGNIFDPDIRKFEEALSTGEVPLIEKAFKDFKSRTTTALPQGRFQGSKENKIQLDSQLSNIGEYVNSLKGSKEFGKLKAQELVGGIPDKIPETSSKKTKILEEPQSLLLTATQTFASSAKELAEALLSEKSRILEQKKEENIKGSLTETNTSYSMAATKLQDIKDKKTKYQTELAPYTKYLEETKYTFDPISSIRKVTPGLSPVIAKETAQKNISFFRDNPTDPKSKEFQSKFPELFKASQDIKSVDISKDNINKLQEQIKILEQRQKEINDRLYFLNDNKNTSPIQQSSSIIPATPTSQTSPQSSTYSSPNNIPQASAQTIQQPIEVSSNRNIKLDINGIISSASSDKELEDRMVASVLAKFTELMDKNLTAMGEKRLTFNSIG